MSAILTFSGEYRFLSNFWLCAIFFEDDWYPSVEHAFQAAKTVYRDKRSPFMDPSPFSCESAKREGRRLDLRADWEQIKLEVMYGLCKFKFAHHGALCERLRNTGDVLLEEGNTWGDTFWGTVHRSGRNELGKILMQVRQEMRCKPR